MGTESEKPEQQKEDRSYQLEESINSLRCETDLFKEKKRLFEAQKQELDLAQREVFQHALHYMRPKLEKEGITISYDPKRGHAEIEFLGLSNDVMRTLSYILDNVGGQDGPVTPMMTDGFHFKAQEFAKLMLGSPNPQDFMDEFVHYLCNSREAAQDAVRRKNENQPKP